MLSQDDNVTILNDFLERGEKRVIIISQAANGQLTPSASFPSTAKQKAVYFMKRYPERLSEEIMKKLIYGDMSHLPLDQLSSTVESVREH